MVSLRFFLERLHFNLINIFQNLGDVVECATQHGAYCDAFVGTADDGGNTYIAIAFEEVSPPAWDLPQAPEGAMTEEELTQIVIKAIEDLIEDGNLDEVNEDEDDFFSDEF